MIKIRFMAYHKTEKRFFEVDSVVPYEDKMTKGGELFEKEKRHSEYYPEDVELLLCSTHNDVNGVNIKEKDIIAFKQFNPNSKVDEDWIAEVYWDEANCALRIRTKTVLRGFFPVQEPTIIGNILEHPEKFV